MKLTPAKWAEYPNFTKSEFDCKHTSKNEMTHEFLVLLQAIRRDFGKGMRVTSGYRDWSHPKEAEKGHRSGEHTKGTCADIACSNSNDRFELVTLALRHGITRIGIARNFLHLGIGDSVLPQRVIWDYS
jgi:zinc D-Ala-D-Ala carboxypeptidase